MNAFLARLRHDVLRPALWAARDLADLGLADAPLSASDRAALRRAVLDPLPGSPAGGPAGGETDRETALDAFRRLRAEAPPDLPGHLLDALDHRLAAAQRAVLALAPGARPAEAIALLLLVDEAFAMLARAGGTARPFRPPA